MSQPSGATQRRRRDGRPVETVPPPARQAPPPDETGLGAVGLTAAVLGGAAGVGAAVAPITAAMPTAQAIALSSAAILASFERFLDGRDRVLESGIFDMLEEEAGDIPEGARLEVVTEEMAAERAYRAKLRARLDRDLPTALMIDDPGSRELEVRKILDRERRIVGQREEAIAVRALGNVEARVVEAKSPEGAYWKLSEFVREHTRDCLAMAGKVWPWTVLRTYHPPLHTGCGCELVAVREAVAMGLPGADRVVSPELAFHAMQVQESSYDVEELEEELRVLEARYGDSRGERYATGTTKGGQFKPRRGATPGRPTGLRMRHRRRTAFDLLDTPDAAPRATPGSPARITKKKGGEMQVGDEVLVGGEWRRVEGVDPKTKGYVVLDGFGPALLDPETSFDVRGSKGDEDAIGGFVPTTDAGRKLAAALKGKRTFDEILAASESVRVDDLSPDELAALERLTDEAERRGASGGEQPPGPDWAKVVRELETMKADHIWSAAEVKRAEGALEAMTPGQSVELKPGMTLRREPHGWIVTSPRGVQAKARAEAMAGGLALELRYSDAQAPDTGLGSLPDDVVKRYADARLAQDWATERRLIVDNLLGMRERGGLERLRYDWRAKLRELDLGEADLTDERRDELRAKAGEANDAARAAGRDVYVEFLRRRNAFEIVDHSDRLKSKPFEIRPRQETVGALGGDAFLRDSGANLRLSRFASREAAERALDALHTRELARLGAGTEKTPGTGRDERVTHLGFRNVEEAALELRARGQDRASYREIDSYQELLTTRDSNRKGLRAAIAALDNPDLSADAKPAAEERVLGLRRNVEELTTEIELRRRAAVHQRRLQALEESRRTGKLSITGEERKALLSETKDVYRDAGIAGPDLAKPPHSPELFRKSDLSGQMVRYYVELPDGRIAHPDELHEALDRGRIVVSADLPRPEGERRYLSELLTDEDFAYLDGLDVGDRYRVQPAQGAQRTLFDRALNREVPAPRRDADAQRLADVLNAADAPARAAEGGQAPQPPAGWDADGFSYGGHEGLPALRRWPEGDRFELRFRKGQTGPELVMWDREADGGKGKPYAVWSDEWDADAVAAAVEEQNMAVRSRAEKAPPAKLTQEQVDRVVTGKAPAGAGEIVPGFAFTGEAGRARDEDGVLHLPAGFFKQSRAIREKVVYRHLGRRLYAEFGDEEIQQMTSFPGGIDVPGTYAALNSPALQGRLEALEPEKSALVARLAVKHGLPLSPQARDWLEKRGIGVEEPDTRAGARGGQADPVELVDAKALAAELGNLDSGTWHTVLAERGYGTVGLKMDGGQITGATWRDVRTGAEIVTDSQAGTATARINRGPRPGVEVTSRIHDSDSSALGELGADGWVWDNAGGGSGAGDTWHRLVHPDGRAFEVYEASNGTLDSERAFTYEPEPEAVESARKRWITTNPAEALREGDSFDRLETALSRAGWQTALDEGRDGSRRIPLPDNAVRLVRLERGDVSVNVVVNPDGRVHSAGYGYRYPDTSERWSEMLTREEHDRRIAELNAEREAEAERVRQRAEADRKAAQGKTSALESWIEAAYSSKGKRAPKVPDDVAAGIVRGRPTNDVVKDLKANGWDVVKAGRGRGKAGPTLSYKLRKMEGPGAGSTISIKGGGTFVDPSVHEVKVTINPQRGRRDRLAPGEVWKDVDELYVDALGRADELGERYGAGVHVTAIYDEGAGAGAAAHHDWSGAIVMGTGQKFRERFNAYLAKRRDGTASHRDHVDFYDALSTLQHEVNHGVAARGPGRGGLAFQSSNYRHDWDRAMEEALTEESARALTLDWLRAQGMTDVLAAVKGMSKSDYRYVGSYTGPRQALENLLRAAGVSDPDERRRLIFRMKFEMTPAERMSVLDDPIIARSDEHAKRRKHMPGSGDMTGHGAPYSPTKVIMGGGWRGRGPASHRGEFAPVIDDPLDDVEAAAPTARLSNGRQVKPGDAVTVTSAADPTQPPQDGVVVAFDGDFVKVRTDDGLELWRNVNRLK